MIYQVSISNIFQVRDYKVTICWWHPSLFGVPWGTDLGTSVLHVKGSQERVVSVKWDKDGKEGKKCIIRCYYYEQVEKILWANS